MIIDSRVGNLCCQMKPLEWLVIEHIVMLESVQCDVANFY